MSQRRRPCLSDSRNGANKGRRGAEQIYYDEATCRRRRQASSRLSNSSPTTHRPFGQDIYVGMCWPFYWKSCSIIVYRTTGTTCYLVDSDECPKDNAQGVTTLLLRGATGVDRADSSAA
eukprot:scaffold337322_cov17-Prasinocladus_malaysianus.AAC.1